MTDLNNKMGWNFDNSYIYLSKRFFSNMEPTPVKSPKLVVYNNTLGTFLGLDNQALKNNEGIDVLAGNKIPYGAYPIAQAYSGHQFGHFTVLGDGRAILLGEQINPKGERFDIQLKGSGRTPYSRGGDGRASLGPMLREYIISEAMYALGIPTTRSLAVVTTGESVIREKAFPGAILTRVASSHIRVGTFQHFSKRGSIEDLKSLAEYTLQRHFPDIASDENRYFLLLKEVIKLQAELIAKWQLVGFIHGVMNTDNMSICGESIDFGPCAFMDDYNPETVFSSIDINGRYAYVNQPQIAAWNLARFAETLLPLLHEDQGEAVKIANEQISDFEKLYYLRWLKGMRAKLGLFNDEPEDESIILDLLKCMKIYKADYTNTFIALTFDTPDDSSIFSTPEFKQWNERWKARLCKQNESKEVVEELMRKSNPALIPRNHRVEAALEAAVKNGDYSVMEKLLNALASPYEHLPEQVEYSKLPELSTGPYRTFCGT